MKKLLILIFIASILLSACGAPQQAPVKKGPYPLPDKFNEVYYYSYFQLNNGCKNSWISKAKSGDANFAGFEIVSEHINTDIQIHNENSAEAVVTYRIFVKTITIEKYLVNIPNQTVEYIGGPNEKSSQALDPSIVLTYANDLAKMAPDIHVGVYYTYYPPKYGTEEWSDEVAIQCDPTNSVVFTISW